MALYGPKIKVVSIPIYPTGKRYKALRILTRNRIDYLWFKGVSLQWTRIRVKVEYAK